MTGHTIPSVRKKKLVLLLGGLARLIPIAGVRIEDQYLVELFDEIIHLPFEAVLDHPRPKSKGRSGKLFVTLPNTKYGESLAQSCLGNPHLTGGEVTIEEVRSRSKIASVLSFFGHATSRETSNKIGLWFDEQVVNHSDIFDVIDGIERIELWGCETGVNERSNLFSPLELSDLHGIDAWMWQVGAKSTLGTLWTVKELPTIALFHVFQKYVGQENSAAKALVLTQCWWIREVIPRLRKHADGLDNSSGPESIICECVKKKAGINIHSSGARSAVDTLGPVKKEELFKQSRKFASKLCSIESWAAFRLIGMANASME